MDQNELQNYLIKLAASITEEDVAQDPVLEEQLKALVQQLSNEPEELDPELVSQLAQIKSKADRFLQAMQMLQVPPDPQTMEKLAVAMRNAGLLNNGHVQSELEEQEPEEKPEEDDGFEEQMKNNSDSEELDIPEEEVIRSSGRPE